jgi:hypothetical protein
MIGTTVGAPMCTAAAAVTPITTDQRGISRPQGPDCDIGATEVP